MLPIVFLDIDNTLITPMRALSNENKDSLLRYIALGGQIVFATGKAPCALEDLLKELNIENSYQIAVNGAVVFNKMQQKYHTLTKIGYRSKAIIEKANQMGMQTYIYYIDKVITAKNVIHNEEALRLAKLNDPYPVYESSIDYDNVVKLVYFVDSTDIQTKEKMKEAFKDVLMDLNLIQTADYLLEVHDIHQTKAKGAQFILDKYNIDIKDCYAIGDSENDLPLLRTVGHPYIVKNALDYMKQYNFKELPSCDENGVSELLDLLIKSE